MIERAIGTLLLMCSERAGDVNDVDWRSGAMHGDDILHVLESPRQAVSTTPLKVAGLF